MPETSSRPPSVASRAAGDSLREMYVVVVVNLVLATVFGLLGGFTVAVATFLVVAQVWLAAAAIVRTLAR